MAKWNKVVVSGSRADLNDISGSAASPMRFPNIGTNGSLRALVIDTNGNVHKATGDFGSSTLSLTNGSIYVGDASNIAAGRVLTGDATITNTGVLRISGSAIGNQTNVSNAITGAEEILILSGSGVNQVLRRSTLTNAMNTLLTPLPTNQIFIGNGSNVATATDLGGSSNITVNQAAGTFTIKNSAVVSAMLSNQVVTGFTGITPGDLPLHGTQTRFFVSTGSAGINVALTYNELTGSLSSSFATSGLFGTTLNSAQINVGDASNIKTPRTITGDVTFSNTGVTTIGATRVVSTMLESNIINAFTAYTTPATLAASTLFAVSDGANKKLTYNQLSGSLSASFAGAGLFGGNKVDGPASATDNAVARFDSTTGKLIKNSGVIIDNSNNVSGIVNLTNTGNTTLGDAAADTVTVNGTTTFVGTTVMTTLQGSGSINGDLTVGGNLTIQGDLTTLNTTNLNIEDKFILLSSGSVSAGDAGIILQQNATTGIAFGYIQATDRFALQKAIAIGANTFGTPTAFVPTVQSAAGDPSTAPQFGGTNGIGTIYVNTTNEDIWIYT